MKRFSGTLADMKGRLMLAPKYDKPPKAFATGVVSFVPVRLRRSLEKPFALRFLARQLAGAADRFGFLARFLLGGFLEMLLELHFPKHAFALELLLQGAERLIDVVVANRDLHVVVTTFPG